MYSVSSEERNWGMLSHIISLAGYLVIPFGNVIGPLVIYLMKKDQSAFIADQARESLNFQISITIYGVIAGLLIFVLIGFALLPIVYIAGFILTIIGAVKASSGVAYRYPLTIRLIS